MSGNNNQYSKCEVGKVEVFELTIPSGTSVSNFFNMSAYTLVGVKFPAAMTSSTVTLQDSFDGVTFEDTYNTNNNLIEWTFTPGRNYKLLPADTAAFINLKIKVDSNEAADRVIKITCRGV